MTTPTKVMVINENDLMEAIRNAKTTTEIDEILRSSISDNVDNDLSIRTNNSNTRICSVQHLSLNVTSTLFRRLAHLSVVGSSRKVNIRKNVVEKDDVIVQLIQTIGERLLLARRTMQQRQQQQQQQQQREHVDDDFNDQQSRWEVLAWSDILQALAVIASRNEQTRIKILPLSSVVLELLDSVDTTTTLYQLKPIRLLQCLQAISRLQIPNSSSLRDKIFERLLKPDAVSQLPTKFLSHGLSTLVSTYKCSSDTEGTETQQWKIKMLSRAFMRRFRKTKVLHEATIGDLVRALVAARDLLKHGVMVDMEDEVAMFGFLCLRRILDLDAMSREGGEDSNLSTAEVVNLLSVWAIVTDPSREDTIIERLLKVLVDDSVVHDCTLDQLVSIVHSVQKLDVKNCFPLAEAVGVRLLHLVTINTDDGPEGVSPKSVNEVVRWPILSFRRQKEIIQPYVDSILFLMQQSPFLSKCIIDDISNFLWFLSCAKIVDEKSLIAMGCRLLDEDMLEVESPTMASRILASFTSLVFMGNHLPSNDLINVQHDLFHSYGVHLLSSSLTPAEISSSLYAYAKASYMRDMGIFDHLVGLLASSRRLCTSRQLSQSLWSCGKIITWEDHRIDDVEAWGTPKEVPYRSDAILILEELKCRADELSPADIAQCVWAMGRLEVGDAATMSTFLHQALQHEKQFSSGQISNILWGMARIQQKDTKVLAKLTHRLTTSKNAFVSPIEASSVLYSLGKLDWYDEVVYETLCDTILDQIEEVNALSVANALWAYRTIGLPVPQRLLNTWAIEKIGLTNLKTLDG